MTRVLKRLRRTLKMLSPAPRGAVDAITDRRVAGWAFARRGEVVVSAWLDGGCIARTIPNIARPDVAHAYPGQSGAAVSGFVLELPGAIQTEVSELRIVAERRNTLIPAQRVLAQRSMVNDTLVRLLSAAPEAGIVGPFPRDVINALAACWPELRAGLDTPEGQARFIDRLLWVMRTPPLNALPAFARYARYLTATLAHCGFVERHFPATNGTASADASDFHSKPNSVSELFAIIHQLYVLQSWGVSGDFAEFGCFKGYSSAMLSFACSQLGVRMHIFDSFAGLPAVHGSSYEAGQYAGSLEEVRENVDRFGSLATVEFHPGFFADSLRDYSPPPLMCLWMDVDLEASAQDLLIVADRLDPRASLFSHECTADIFRDDRIVTAPHPDNPIHPLVVRHEHLGRSLVGHHVAGYTGAFWPRVGGTPVLGTPALGRLMRALA